MPLGIGLYQLSRRRIHGAKFISKKKQLISFDIVLRHPSTFHIGNREMEHCRWKVGDSLMLAREIAGTDANAEIQELARRVAEAEIDLRRVRYARHQLL